MKLAVWLKAEGKTQAAFADELGMSQSYIAELCAGNKWPGRRTAELLRDLVGDLEADARDVAGDGTEGKVWVSEWVPSILRTPARCARGKRAFLGRARPRTRPGADRGDRVRCVRGR